MEAGLAEEGPLSLLISFNLFVWAQAKTVGDLHFRLRFEMSLNLNRPSISPTCLGVTRNQRQPTCPGGWNRTEIK